jgi:long-subunit fatty acid transport protein
MNTKWRCPFSLGLIVFVLFAIDARAQDFYQTATSAESLAHGGVYIPSSTSVLDALAANPAGLTAIGGRTLDASVSTVFARGSFVNSVNTDGTIKSFAGVLPYGAFGTPIGHSRFSIGLGVMPEMMMSADWTYVDAPGAAGATYGLQQNKSAILGARSAAGLGINFGPRFSLGFTVGAVYNTNTLQAPYIFQTNPVLAGAKTLLDLHTNGIGWNGSVGVLARPTPRVQIGLSYKSRTTVDSHGTATGNAGVQFAALGLGGARPDFAYNAEVQNMFPQSMLASVAWQARSTWQLALQSGWIDWKRAFVALPVTLTNGNNADINGLLGSNSLSDTVPLHWKDQFTFRAGVVHSLGENLSWSGGFAHSTNPVPSATLTPMTAAITGNQLSTGLSYGVGPYRFNFAYSLGLTAQENVTTSSLLAGEYNNSQVRVGTQALTFGTQIRF